MEIQCTSNAHPLQFTNPMDMRQRRGGRAAHGGELTTAAGGARRRTAAGGELTRIHTGGCVIPSWAYSLGPWPRQIEKRFDIQGFKKEIKCKSNASLL